MDPLPKWEKHMSLSIEVKGRSRMNLYIFTTRTALSNKICVKSCCNLTNFLAHINLHYGVKRQRNCLNFGQHPSFSFRVQDRTKAVQSRGVTAV